MQYDLFFKAYVDICNTKKLIYSTCKNKLCIKNNIPLGRGGGFTLGGGVSPQPPASLFTN